ncbi:MAG: DUF6146 family protein [Jejuia sp.]
MKNLIFSLTIIVFAFSCKTSKSPTSTNNKESDILKKNDTIRIANEELEYEVIIIDPLFPGWLASNARQRGFYSQQFFETRNQFFVIEWNQRVLQPQRFNPRLYEFQIDYDPNIDYGYEVNYLLYNYFLFFQINYKQRLGPFVPRI